MRAEIDIYSRVSAAARGGHAKGVSRRRGQRYTLPACRKSQPSGFGPHRLTPEKSAREDLDCYSFSGAGISGPSGPNLICRSMMLISATNNAVKRARKRKNVTLTAPLGIFDAATLTGISS